MGTTINIHGSNSIFVVSGNNSVVINGIEYPFVKGMKGKNIQVRGRRVIIDGYELMNGEWKRKVKF